MTKYILYKVSQSNGNVNGCLSLYVFLWLTGEQSSDKCVLGSICPRFSQKEPQQQERICSHPSTHLSLCPCVVSLGHPVYPRRPISIVDPFTRRRRRLSHDHIKLEGYLTSILQSVWNIVSTGFCLLTMAKHKNLMAIKKFISHFG